MALTLVATVGSATANSYVTRLEADTYMAARLNVDAWTDADDPNVALAEATRELSLLSWAGARTDGTQVLAWPRQWVVDPDTPLVDPGADYPYYEDNIIPVRVKNATCELALEYLRAGTTDLSKPDTAGIAKAETVGPIKTEFEVPPAALVTGLARFPRIVALIAPLLSASASGGLDVVRT